MEDAHEDRDRLWRRAGKFLVHWIVLNMAIWPVVIGLGLILSIPAAFAASDVGLGGLLVGFSLVYGAGLGIFFSVLGAPFLLFQKWIVAPSFPYLRWGYLAVAAYGPLLLLIWAWSASRDWRMLLHTTLIYEFVALVATVLSARIGRAGGLFDDERRHKRVAGGPP